MYNNRRHANAVDGCETITQAQTENKLWGMKPCTNGLAPARGIHLDSCMHPLFTLCASLGKEM